MTDETKAGKAAEKAAEKAKSKATGATGPTGATGATGATDPADRHRATPVMETAEVQAGLEANRAKEAGEAGGEPGVASTQAQPTDNPWDRIYGPNERPPAAETGDIEVPEKGYIGTQPGDDDFGRA
jgi:hypothetical protein